MNGLVPVMIAVLLAEFGPRMALYADARIPNPLLWVIAAGVIAAAMAGALIAPGLTEWADAFLIAVALAFAAFGQAQRIDAIDGTVPRVIAFWRGGVPLLAFGFATRFGALSVAAGVMGGVVAAAVLTGISRSSGVPIAPIRWAAAAILAVAAVVVAVGALRLT